MSCDNCGAMRTARCTRCVPPKAALLRAAVHGIRLTLAPARRPDAAAAKEVSRGVD